ncbi:hypothetical protein TB2_041090 [Malus domestica]
MLRKTPTDLYAIPLQAYRLNKVAHETASYFGILSKKSFVSSGAEHLMYTSIRAVATLTSNSKQFLAAISWIFLPSSNCLPLRMLAMHLPECNMQSWSSKKPHFFGHLQNKASGSFDRTRLCIEFQQRVT